MISVRVCLCLRLCLCLTVCLSACLSLFPFLSLSVALLDADVRAGSLLPSPPQLTNINPHA